MTGATKLLSVNLGTPRLVPWNGQSVATGIFKQPVDHPVQMQQLNLDGDRQADLTVHGGPDKAVYAYPSEHYEFWKGELPGTELPWGMFGENCTTQGLMEDEVCVGDRFRIGQAEVTVTQPRLPCYKLGIKFGRHDMVKRFLQSERSGFYFSVNIEGAIGAGDAIEALSRDSNGVLVRDVVRLYVAKQPDTELLRRVIQVKALPASWRDYFLQRLEAPA